jgi:hypothetical protein
MPSTGGGQPRFRCHGRHHRRGLRSQEFIGVLAHPLAVDRGRRVPRHELGGAEFSLATEGPDFRGLYSVVSDVEGLACFDCVHSGCGAAELTLGDYRYSVYPSASRRAMDRLPLERARFPWPLVRLGGHGGPAGRLGLWQSSMYPKS